MMCDDCGPSMGEEAYFEMLCNSAGWENYEEDELWHAGTGTMLIVDMDDKHLNNAIARLKRTLTEADASGWEGAPNGMDRLIGQEIDEMEHKLSLLKVERERRGLTASDPFAPLKPFIVGRKS